MPIRAASAVGAETNAATESDDLLTAVADSSLAITLDDAVPLLPKVGPAPGHIRALSQLQPTTLKKVSLKKAIILTVVVVAAVVVITLAYGITHGGPILLRNARRAN
jgi:hypothetical protein